MFIIENNEAKPLDSPKFADLGFSERKHLQEWIAKNPDVLGEELLIIQKEYSGFDKTNERLDLLALDKKGNLVVIENKLDDSGKDVTWQALKYASYCSASTAEDIVQIFQQYLGDTKDAKETLCDFFEQPDFSIITLNGDENEQRIILVAADFRPEVTSAVLWLFEQGINMKCIKVTPYEHDGKTFIGTEQIIPVKGAEELQVRIVNKRQLEKRITAETQRQYSASQKTFQDNYYVFKQMVDEASDLLLQQSGGNLSRKRTDGRKSWWYYIQRITGFNWGTCCFGHDHNGWRRLSKHGIVPDHHFCFILTKEEDDVDYDVLNQEFLEKCGFFYTYSRSGWWIYDRPLELDKDDITPQKIADAVMKIANELTEAYHKAKSQ